MLDRVLRPIKTKIAAAGIRHSIYIDDGHVIAASKEEAAEALSTVFKILMAADFQLSMSKSDTAQSVAQGILGVRGDARNM